MDFSDTKDEAAFRAEARQWIAENAPAYLHEALATSGFGSTRTGEYDPLEEARKWQKKKADAGWACIQWPRAYGGQDATPIQSVIWNQEEGVYGRLSGTFIIKSRASQEVHFKDDFGHVAHGIHKFVPNEASN